MRLERADDPSGASRRAASKLRWLLRAAGWVAETRRVDRAEAIAFFAAHRPASFGLSKGSYATYKTAVLSAIGEGRRRSRARDVRDIDGPYAEIQARVRASTALPADLRHSGGPLLTYLHDQGVAPDRITTEVLEAYHRHRLATGVKTEAACVKAVKRAALLLARLQRMPEFAPFGIAAPPHPFGDGRRRYGAADADAAIAALMAEFDARVAPWSRGEVSCTGLDRTAFIAELDRQTPPAEGKKGLLRKRGVVLTWPFAP